MIIQGMSYLTDPNKQFVTKGGAPNVGGFVRVYLANTDDPATTYSDFNGTRNQQDIRLDNNGRAVIIAKASKAYRVEVYDHLGGLQWTVQPLFCLEGSDGGGGGGGGMQPTCKVQYNDDGLDVYSDEFDFVKENVLGNYELSFPRGWYQVNVSVTLENQSARDLIHDFKIDWSFERIENGSPVFFDAHLPDLKTQLDCTTTWKRKLYGSMLFIPYATQDGDWLTYSIDIPSNMTYAIDLDIAKVRDE